MVFVSLELGVLFHGDHHAAQLCFYSGPERRDTLVFLR